MTRPEEFAKRYGPWALVAGGARGIGLAYAEYVAARGLDVILLDVDADALRSSTEDLARRHGVKTLGVCLDLADEDLLQKLSAAAGDREVGLLVYNAALADVGPFFKAQGGLDYELRKIAINVTGPLTLVYHFGKLMLRRRRGGIILMSSGAGMMGAPYYTHYSATKAYSINLAEGLFHEFKPYGVDVLACIAGMTLSSSAEQFLKRGEGTGLQYQTCEDLVAEAMQALGTKASLICNEVNRRNFAAMAALPREEVLRHLAAHAIDNFLGGKVPDQNV